MARVSISIGWLVTLILALGLACIIIALLVQPPRRWQEPLGNLRRAQVHMLLGVPDADFSVKGWDAWDQPKVVGAWVLTVRYDNERVIQVQKKFDWGFDYLSWDRSYRAWLDGK